MPKPARKSLRVVRRNDDVTINDPVSYVGDMPSEEVFRRITGEFLNPKQQREAITRIEEELHDIRVEIRQQNHLLGRIADAAEKIARLR